jgi:hypothetical protein
MSFSLPLTYNEEYRLWTRNMPHVQGNFAILFAFQSPLECAREQAADVHRRDRLAAFSSTTVAKTDGASEATEPHINDSRTLEMMEDSPYSMLDTLKMRP